MMRRDANENIAKLRKNDKKQEKDATIDARSSVYHNFKY